MKPAARKNTIGNAYRVTIGDNATGVAVGEHIHQQVGPHAPRPEADRQQVKMLLADLDEALAQASRLLSSYEAHMAAFHVRLLHEELLKTDPDGRPSADILMMAGTWLLTRTPGLAAVLLRLLLAASTTAVITRAGEGMMNWVESRAAGYEVAGFRLNLVELRQVLTTLFNLSELRTLCFDMAIAFEDLYGEGKADKARELVAYCVRHGRVPELAARCRDLRPQAFAEDA